MKIAIISGLAGSGARAGGVWQAVVTQALALSRAGHDVRVLSGYLNDPPGSHPEINAKYLRLHRPFSGAGLRGLWSAGLPAAVDGLARWADVAHINICRDLFTMPAALLMARRKIPIVGQPHGMLTSPQDQVTAVYDRVLSRVALPEVGVFLFISQQERNDLLTLGIAGNRLRVFSHATNAPPHQWREPELPMFLFASRLHPRKQPSVFVDAALRLLKGGADASFVLAGPDEGEEVSIRRRIDESSFRSRFQILGDVPHSHLMRLLSQSTAMILPSMDEPYGLIIIEALSMGVPAIVTEQTGIRQLLEQHHAAYLVDPTLEGVYKGMQRLLADRPLRSQLSVSGRSLYGLVWRPEALAERLELDYRAAINGPSSWCVTDTR